LCVQLTRDLLAIATFLVLVLSLTLELQFQTLDFDVYK